MSNCIECGNEYELHSTDGSRCPKNQGNLIDGKLEFFATHFDAGLSEVEQLRQALTEANERIEYANAGPLVIIPRELVLAMEAKLKDKDAEIALLVATVERMTNDLEDDEAADTCTCGHSLDSHTKSGVHPCGECECLMFWAKVAK